VKSKILFLVILAINANVMVKADHTPDDHTPAVTVATTVSRISDLRDFPDGKVIQKTKLPFLDKSYVPQGVAHSTTGQIYQAYDAPSAQPSIILEFTNDGQNLSRYFKLKTDTGAWFTGHSGGLAHYKGSVYVTSGSSIRRFKLIDAKLEGGNRYTLKQCDKYTLKLGVGKGDNTKNDGIDIWRAGDASIAWVQEYDRENYQWILGYRVNSNGDINTNAIHRFKMPLRYVQGVACYQANANSYGFYFVTSWFPDLDGLGRGVYKVLYENGEPKMQKIMDLPRGCQDPAYDVTMKRLWIASESGATKYHVVESWVDLYPYLFYVRP
jgi:hypothetical protein